jgi:molecular chaperone DnaK (HSP70)
VRFFGRNFNDPAIASAVKSYPLPVTEDPSSHTCSIHVGRGVYLTPDGIATDLLSAVKNSAERYAGEPVSDASIAVPTFFTSVQRIAIRDAAERAGLRIVHIVSPAIAAARAMKLAGQLDPGFTVIVDVVASKTGVSLIRSTENAVHEVRTVGTLTVGVDDVRNGVIELCLPAVKVLVGTVTSSTSATFASAVVTALVGRGRIYIPNLGNSESLVKRLTESELADACGQVMKCVKGLLREVLGLASVGTVVCIGAGTLLAPIVTTVKLMSKSPGGSPLRANRAIVRLRSFEDQRKLVIRGAVDKWEACRLSWCIDKTSTRTKTWTGVRIRS